LLDVLDSASYDVDFTSVLLFVRWLEVSASSSCSLTFGRGSRLKFFFFFLLFAQLFSLFGLLLLLGLLFGLLFVEIVEEGVNVVRWLITHILVYGLYVKCFSREKLFERYYSFSI
jgi:hypothetical protein